MMITVEFQEDDIMEGKARRKALVRDYKETRRPMGAYRILNTSNGKALVGVSVNLPAILNRHRAQLRMRSHTNKALQKDWDELGPTVFAFEILDTLEPSERRDADSSADLSALEELWLDKLSPFAERGYNVRPKSTS